LIILTILGEEYKPCSSSLCSFLGIYKSNKYKQNLIVLHIMYHSKRNPTTITYNATKIKSEAGPPHSPNVPHDTRDKVILVPTLLLKTFAQKLCMYEKCSFTNKTCVLSRTSKQFVAVREAFSNAYPDKEVPNKTTIHLPVTKFRDTGSVCLWQLIIERQNSWDYVRIDFKQCISCNNGIRPQEFNIAVGFVVLCLKAIMFCS
jgi:hypothetical protein